MANILNTYQKEIRVIEASIKENISSINKITIPLILEDIRVNHHGEREYMSLYNEIALACTEYNLMNSLDIETRGQGRIEIISTEHMYGPEYLYGEHGAMVPVGQTLSRSIGISLGVGTTIAEEFELSVAFEISETQSFEGPPYGYELPNGKLATHGMPVGFCYGSIINVVWKYIENESGDEWIFESTEIDPNASMEMYTMVTCKESSGHLYIAHITDPNKYFSFSSESKFEEKLRTDPTLFF